jgi:HAD superfamily hydrolase (TIGR01549 family)
MSGASAALRLPRPDAVLIDLDDTLYAYAPAHEAALSAVRQRCMVRLGLEQAAFDGTFETARAQVKAALGPTASAHNRLLYFHRLIELSTKKSDPMLALELEKIYWRRFLSSAELFPDARDFIDELRYAKIPTALVTDLTAQVQLRKLVYFELDHAFDVVVTSEEVGADKPDARMYEAALSKLGLGKHARLWMLGDCPEKDIRGAKQAVSAFTIQKLHAGVSRADGADLHVDDFSTLLALTRALLGSQGAPA